MTKIEALEFAAKYEDLARDWDAIAVRMDKLGTYTMQNVADALAIADALRAKAHKYRDRANGPAWRRWFL